MNVTDGSSGSAPGLDKSKWRVSEAEYLMGRDKLAPLSSVLSANMEKLLIAANLIRDLYGKPLAVSSGYRPPTQNAAAGGAGKSCHLTCEAIDFADPKGDLARWLLANMDILEQARLYMESPMKTVGWVHLQTRAPRSGKRVFLP